MRKPAWIDNITSSDPAFNRLWSTCVSIASMGLAMLAEWILVTTTGALGSKISRNSNQAQIALHHEVLILALLVGGMLGLLLGFSFDESDIKGTFIASLIPAAPLLATALLALLLGNHRDIDLALSPLLLGIGTLFRKYGPRGSSVGIMMYVGGFFGYFLSLQFSLGAFWWFSLEVLVAIGAILLVRIPFVHFQARYSLKHAIRSYTSRARLVAELAIDALSGDERSSLKLKKTLIQLNETALIIEAYMSRRQDVSPQMRQSLFDLELSLTNVARFSDAIGKLHLPSLITRNIADYIRSIPESKTERFSNQIGDELSRWRTFIPKDEEIAHIILGRLTDSLINLNNAVTEWEYFRNAYGTQKLSEKSEMTHITQLRLGQLPGSSQISAAASLEPSSDLNTPRFGLAPELRAAIQITVATGLATGIGYALDPQRFYWASLSALLCFTGVNNTGEQIRKSVYRLLGTVLGVIAGSIIAGAVGAQPIIDLVVILVSMFLGTYLARINYTFLAIAVTISISILFVQLGEFSNSLLAERIIETAAGALVAALTALFVIPLSPKRVIIAARKKFLIDLSSLVLASIRYLKEPENEDELLGWSREVDADYLSLLSTVSPLSWSMLGALNRDVTELLSIATAIRNYAKSLVADVKRPSRLPEESITELEAIQNQLQASISTLTQSNSNPRFPYTRISSLVHASKSKLGIISTPNALTKIDLVLRDITLLDGALASMAAHLEIPVKSLDLDRI